MTPQFSEQLRHDDNDDDDDVGDDDANMYVFEHESRRRDSVSTSPKEETAQNLDIFHSAIGSPFETMFKPGEMRQLALVAHNHMKPATRLFIETHAEILKKFCITGTNTTMSMCKSIFGDDESVVYGKSCTSGLLGGNAQLAALMCLEDVGGIIFFMDPLSAHPHQADIDSLVRLSNVTHTLLCPNPTTAISTMWVFRHALIANNADMVSIVSRCDVM